MAKTFKVGVDGNSIPSYRIPMSDAMLEAAVLANTVTTMTVPANCSQVIFVATDVFYWSRTTFSLVTSNTFVVTTAELQPNIRPVTPGETLYIRAPRACNVQAAFYNQSGVEV